MKVAVIIMRKGNFSLSSWLSAIATSRIGCLQGIKVEGD